MSNLQEKCRGRRKSQPTAVKSHERRCNLAGKTVSPRADDGKFGAHDFSLGAGGNTSSELWKNSDRMGIPKIVEKLSGCEGQ